MRSVAHTGPGGLAAAFYELGYVFPLDIFSADEAIGHRRDLERLEARIRQERVGNRDQLNYPHVIFRFANRIVRDPRLLDAIEELLGSDLLVWGATFFIKEPHTESYASWHQDLRYWGLDDVDSQVSAWIALGPVTIANGCMRFVPKSHKGPIVPHLDTYAEENVLTRGQEAQVEIDEQKIVHVELFPGQVSLHHGKLLHASAPNRTDERRIGLSIQFIAPHVRQTVARKDYAMLVRGEDRYRHFEHVPAPSDDLSEAALMWHNRILDAQNEAMYDGAETS